MAAPTPVADRVTTLAMVSLHMYSGSAASGLVIENISFAMLTGYINHGGGSPGADEEWDTQGRACGVMTRAYRPEDDPQPDNPSAVVIHVSQLQQALPAIQKAAATMSCSEELASLSPKQLHYISRNWFQAANAEAVYVVARLIQRRVPTAAQPAVSGGTKWVVSMAVAFGKPVYVFDHEEGDVGSSDSWFMYDYSAQCFVPCADVPVLTTSFAGVGSRSIGQPGRAAVAAVYQRTCQAMHEKHTSAAVVHNAIDTVCACSGAGS